MTDVFAMKGATNCASNIFLINEINAYALFFKFKANNKTDFI